MKTIIGNIMPEENADSYLDEGILRDFSVERNDENHIVNHIYKGTIQNILPAMQAAFVNIGRRKNAFCSLAISFPGQRRRNKSNRPAFLSARAYSSRS